MTLWGQFTGSPLEHAMVSVPSPQPAARPVALQKGSPSLRSGWCSGGLMERGGLGSRNSPPSLVLSHPTRGPVLGLAPGSSHVQLCSCPGLQHAVWSLGSLAGSYMLCALVSVCREPQLEACMAPACTPGSGHIGGKC